MKKTTNLRSAVLRYVSIAVCACLLIAVGVVGGKIFFGPDKQPIIESEIVTVIDIDVNPSIEISADKNDKVVKVAAINSDAEKILDGMNLKNVDLNIAINAVIGSMAKNGYLNNGKILVTVLNDNPQKAQTIRNEVMTDINASLKENSSNAEAEKFAKENGISVGKAIFILNLSAKDNTLDTKSLSNMSLKEIAQIVKDKKIDIRDIVNYDADDSIFENIEDQIEDDNLLSQVNITAAEAKEKALTHANLKAEDVTFIKVELDDENGKPFYEVEFVHNNVKYEYDINGTTGEIIKTEKEEEKKPASKPDTTPKYITVDEAKKKALVHANVPADVRFVKAEFDYDDGAPIYELEFIYQNAEYEYDIDALNGTILDFEVEKKANANQNNTQSGNQTNNPNNNQTSNRITEDEAKKKALAHAGVAKPEKIKVEFDKDDGKEIYEVEFTYNGKEYDYEIDAKTGKVIDYESEPIDND